MYSLMSMIKLHWQHDTSIVIVTNGSDCLLLLWHHDDTDSGIFAQNCDPKHCVARASALTENIRVG